MASRSELEQPETALGHALIRLIAAADRDPTVREDPAAALRLLAREGATLVSATETIVCTLRGQGEIEVVAASGRLSPLVGTVGKLEGSLPERALDLRHSVMEPADARLQPLLGSQLVDAGAKYVCAFPLESRGIVRDEFLGAFVAARFSDEPFDEEEERLLRAYALLVALSLARSRRQATMERSTGRWQLGVDLAIDLGTAASPEEVNQRLVTRAALALGADRATLLRMDGGDVVVEATQDVEGLTAMPGFRFKLESQPLFLAAYESRQPTFEGSLVLETLPQPLQRALGQIKHMVLMPLVLSGEVLGFLNLHRRSDMPFLPDDVATLQLVGNLAAVMLRNARLLADTQAARQAMSDFLHVVIHEMRGPLTIITGYINMIEEGVFGPPPDALSRPLQTIDNKLHETQQLVDELLVAARFESGNLPVSVEVLDIADSARRAMERAQPRALLQGAKIVLDAPQEVWTRADRGHLDRILDNLVNNALTHGGEHAEVTISVHGPAPEVTVSDNGPGIPAAERERIFERFYRGEARMPGTGLGLYISRQLAQASGCILELGSAGPGAHFVLNCPPAEVGHS